MEDPEPIAIIGMSCRFPHSNNPQEFWQLLEQGRDGVGPVPRDRLEKGIISSGYKYSQANYLPSSIAIDEFDQRFFQVSQKTAKFMDPQLRLLLEVVWEALEDSSVNPQHLRGSRTGIFVGSWLRDYQKIGLLSPEKDFFLVYMGNSMAARMAFFLGTVGPAIDSESACSSSMVAVHQAYQSLRDKSIDLAVVGGVNVIIEPPSGTDLDIGFATCLDGRCKPFDAEADGYGRGEGCGALILKRLSTAIKDGDRILALIKGSAVTQEGLSRSMGTPTIHSEALAMSLALNDAGVDPADVSYIEAHGTGTKVGDPIEIAAISKVYSSQSRVSPLIIGTVKANVGHSEACSGIASIIKVILCLQNQTIPKHINFKHCNPEIDFEKIPAVLPMENMKWSSDNGKPRMAGVSSFGIGGTDCHVILQEYFDKNQNQTVIDEVGIDRPLHIMTISAKTEEALELYVDKYCLYLQETDNKLEDIAYTANTCRALFDHKLVIIASDKAEAVKKLTERNYLQSRIANKKNDTPKICMLFPGQGSQYPGMAKDLYEQSPIFRQNFDNCCKIVLEETTGDCDLKSILWGNDSANDMLNKSINSQVAVLCVDYCLYKLWGSWGIKPDYVLGHSLGESAAVVAVGARDLRNGLKALLLKCQLVDELAHGKMIAVRLDQSNTQKLIDDFISNNSSSKNLWLDVAAVNSPEQTVLSGESDCIDKFHKYCLGENIKSTIIASSHAFHSRMLEPVLNEIKTGIASIRQSSVTPTMNGETGIKYISSSEAKLMDYDALLQEDYWVANTRNTVQFMEACQVAFDEGCRIFIEVGAQPILSALVKANYNYYNTTDGGPVLCLPSLRRNENNWETLLTSLAQFSLTERGNDIDWKEFDKPYSRRKVSLPHYPFVRKRFWIDKSQISCFNSSNVSFNQGEYDHGHPLLGFPMEIASENIHIFQSNINLAQQDMEYFKDHSIGNLIIFPGAGFLELMVAAIIEQSFMTGEEKCSRARPVLLENIKITCPLQLEMESSCRMQIVATKTFQDGNCEVKVSRFKNAPMQDSIRNSGWVDHITAGYNLNINLALTDVLSDVNLKTFLENSFLNDNEIIQLYREELPLVGLHFGDSFRTLQTVWRDPNDSDSILVEMKIDLENIRNYSSSRNYHIHPVIADGMIQSTLLILPRNVLHVPVEIKRFTLIRDLDHCKKLFVYCKCLNNEEEKSFDVYLLDEENRLMASMEGLKMHATTVANVKMRLSSGQEGNGKALPQFWKEIWTLSNSNPLAGKQNFPSANSTGSMTSNQWLLIGPDKEFAEIFQKHLDLLGREDVTLLSNFTNDGKMRSKEALVNLLGNQLSSIKGIIYLNGLKKTEQSQENICLEFLHVCKWLQGNYHLPQVQYLQMAVVTHGVHFVEGSDQTFNPSPATLGGMINTLKSECPKLSAKCIDLSHKPSYKEQIPNLCREILDIDGWKDGQVALRYHQRYVARFVAASVPTPKMDTQNKEVPLFKYRCSTYMVTGGLSGLGFQVASWMLENGANRMILVGRTSPKPEVSKIIKEWNEQGKRVHIYNADVGNPLECNCLFNWIQDSELPPLRGIFHCAGVLADASIVNQTWTNFEAVFGPKVNGSWNLHTLSLYYQLDYFVMFSSISSLFGIPGQINYAAGNCYQDALTRYRHSLGLPATTINWGNWEGVGMASHLQFPGLKPITIQQGLIALEVILRGKMKQVAVANFYSFQEFARLCPRVNGYVDEKLLEGEPSSSKYTNSTQKTNEYLQNNAKNFGKELAQVQEGSQKLMLIQKYINMAVRSLLKLNISEEIDVHVEFHALGIDSLMLIELHSKLQEMFGENVKITPSHLTDFPSVMTLSKHLVEQLIP